MTPDSALFLVEDSVAIYCPAQWYSKAPSNKKGVAVGRPGCGRFAVTFCLERDDIRGSQNSVSESPWTPTTRREWVARELAARYGDRFLSPESLTS
jgi:hypothetical protein